MKGFKTELEEAKRELQEINAETQTLETLEETEEEKNSRVREKDGITYIDLYNGDVVELKLNSITGNLIVEAKNRVKLKRKNDVIMIEELDDYYYIFVAEMIGNKKAKYLLNLKYKDYNLVRNVVRNFLSED